jgi:hypothetical protein
VLRRVISRKLHRLLCAHNESISVFCDLVREHVIGCTPTRGAARVLLRRRCTHRVGGESYCGLPRESPLHGIAACSRAVVAPSICYFFVDVVRNMCISAVQVEPDEHRCKDWKTLP